MITEASEDARDDLAVPVTARERGEFLAREEACEREKVFVPARVDLVLQPRPIRPAGVVGVPEAPRPADRKRGPHESDREAQRDAAGAQHGGPGRRSESGSGQKLDRVPRHAPRAAGLPEPFANDVEAAQHLAPGRRPFLEERLERRRRPLGRQPILKELRHDRGLGYEIDEHDGRHAHEPTADGPLHPAHAVAHDHRHPREREFEGDRAGLREGSPRPRRGLARAGGRESRFGIERFRQVRWARDDEIEIPVPAREFPRGLREDGKHAPDLLLP